MRRPEVEAVDICLPHHLHLPATYEAFVAAVLGGPAMLTDPASTRKQVELARAISRSLAEKQPVRLPLRPGDPYYGPAPGYDA